MHEHCRDLLQHELLSAFHDFIERMSDDMDAAHIPPDRVLTMVGQVSSHS